MNKARVLVTGAALLASLVAPALQAYAQPPVPPEPFLQKADLPVGGVIVPDPRIKPTVYYYLDTERLRSDASNARKYAGLYRSNDGGQTWQRQNGVFEFERLFINPTTGELFALIRADAFQTLGDGSLSVEHDAKIVKSQDGQHWKDITGKQQYLKNSWSLSLIPDPDHPQQVRISGWQWNRFFLVPADNDYSNWTKVEVTGPTF